MKLNFETIIEIIQESELICDYELEERLYNSAWQGR
jgi:hypothetical protein